MAEYDEDDFTQDEMEAHLQEQGLIGDTLVINCAQVEDDYMTIRRIGTIEAAAEADVEGLEPVVSLMCHVAEVVAVDGHVVSGVMLTAEGARVVAAHLLNSADEIDGFQHMFDIKEGNSNG